MYRLAKALGHLLSLLWHRVIPRRRQEGMPAPGYTLTSRPIPSTNWTYNSEVHELDPDGNPWYLPTYTNCRCVVIPNMGDTPKKFDIYAKIVEPLCQRGSLIRTVRLRKGSSCVSFAVTAKGEKEVHDPFI